MTPLVIPWEGGVGGEWSLQDGAGSLAKSAPLPKDGGAGPVPSVRALLLLISWTSVCRSLL